MKSPYFNEEHQLFRDSLRAFIQTEFQPYFAEWEKENAIPRWAWKKMGEMGYLGICHEEEYGGMDADMFYQVVFNEELSTCAVSMSNDVIHRKEGKYFV